MWPFSDSKIAEREFERLVVRVPNWLGDQIMATPALDAIRRRYPNAHIAGHGSRGAEMLYAGSEWFDSFLVSEKRDPSRAQAKLLKQGNFDACLLLTGSFRTAIPPFLARIPHRIGYRWSGRTPLLTAHWHRPRPGGKKAPYPTKYYYIDLVAKIGADQPGERVHLPLRPEVVAKSDEWLAGQGIAPDEPLLPMCVGAKFGPSKLWPAEYFAQAADHMTREHGARVILLCAPGEEEIGAQVRGLAKEPLVDTGLDPLTIEMLKAVIARSRVLLTNDTGPRHIAASYFVPAVTVMGSTDPTYTDTDMENQTVLRVDGLDCSPCHLKVCPLEGHPCMTRLTPDRVLGELERIWKNPPVRPEAGVSGGVG